MRREMAILSIDDLDTISDVDDSQFESIERAVKTLGKTHFI